MEMLSSPRVATEHKLRIAQALVDEHMRRAETIPPEQVADIEAAIAQHQHMASPVEGASDTLPSVSMDSDAPYRAVIAYAASLAWRKKLSEVQCKELLQRAGKTLATDAHRMEIVKMPTMPALKQPMPALDYLDLASLQAPLPDVSIDPESRGTTGKWNQRRVAPIGVFGPIPSYLNQGYKTINNELREFGHSYDGRKVKEALEKYIPNYAYTGISFRGSFALDNSKTQTPYCAEGGTFTDRSFFSTTLSAISGARYAKRPPDYNIASTVRSGLFNTMFHVIGRTGVCVGGSEWEVLYRSNTVFDVIFNGFDYRNRMHKPVLVEKDVEVPKGSQKKDILPPQPLGKAIDTAHALSNNTFKTSMEELKFHVATALQHLPAERVAEVLFEFIAWPSLRLTTGESDSSKETLFKTFQNDLPLYRHWTADNLSDLLNELKEFIPPDIYRRFNQDLTFDMKKIKPLIENTVDALTTIDSTLDQTKVRKFFENAVNKELIKRHHRIAYSKDANDLDYLLWILLAEEFGHETLRKVHWGNLHWKETLSRLPVSQYPWYLEKIVDQHNKEVQETETGEMVDLDDLMRKVIKSIGSFSSSDQVISALEPYLKNIEEERENMINALNEFFRQELKFPHQSFQRRYKSNAANYPFSR